MFAWMVPWSAQRRCFARPHERVSSSPCHSTPSFKQLTEKTLPNPDHPDLLRPSACTYPADFAMSVNHHECQWVQCGALSCQDLSQWVAESCPDLLDWPRGSEHQWNRSLNKFQTLLRRHHRILPGSVVQNLVAFKMYGLPVLGHVGSVAASQ